MDSADSGQADLIFVFLGVSAFDFVIRKLEGLKGVAGRQRTPLPDSILVRNECAGERSSFHFFSALTADSGQADLFLVCFGFLTSILVAGSWRVRGGLWSTKKLLPPAPSW
jgi:hypothetical protein